MNAFDNLLNNVSVWNFSVFCSCNLCLYSASTICFESEVILTIALRWENLGIKLNSFTVRRNSKSRRFFTCLITVFSKCLTCLKVGFGRLLLSWQYMGFYAERRLDINKAINSNRMFIIFRILYLQCTKHEKCFTMYKI